MNKCTCKTDNWDDILKQSREALPEDILAFIDECNQKPHPESYLISILHKVQAHYGHLGRSQMNAVAQLMQVPTAKVTGVASFYHFFRLTPPGRFSINVCLGTACYVKGGDQVAEKLKQELGIDFGETTADGMFSLDAARCLGTCGLAPVIMVNEHVHPKVKPDDIPSLLARYRESAKNT